LGIGDWANPQSPIPNTQINKIFFSKFIKIINNIKKLKINKLKKNET